MIRPILFAVLVALPGIAAAQEQDTVVSDTTKRIRQVFIYGNEPCPTSTSADEIVVCQRAPAEEQYRIPPRFREPAPSPANQAWQNRVTTVEEVNRIGLPGSCSPVGAGGQTGCARQAAERAAAERRADEAAAVPPD